MPKSVYLICSQSGSEDQLTGLVSLFAIYERVQITRRSKGAEYSGTPSEMIACRITAAWEREKDDPVEEEYTVDFVLHYPHRPDKTVISVSQFRFDSDFQRFTVHTHLGMFVESPGLYRVESRVHTTSGITAVSALFPILVTDNMSDE